MFIKVRLFTGFNKLLTYHVPDQYKGLDLIGKIVQVPLQNRLIHAIVKEQINQLPAQPFTIKTLTTINTFPEDIHYISFINQLADYYQIDSYILLQRLQSFLEQEQAIENPVFMSKQNSEQITLTTEQEATYQFLAEKIAPPCFCPTLLHGVTGSGKTEIYKKLIMKAYEQKKTTLFLLPEVTLALQFTEHFKNTLNLPIFSFHSQNTKSEKELLWHALLTQQPMLIVGVHLPIMLPINNLGLIIVDEEHEVGYQEKKHPKINTKEAALLRAQRYTIPILLGSATPSISSLYNVAHKHWHFFQLKKRFAGNFPTITTVSLLKNKLQRRNFWISRELETAIKDRLNKKEQSIIFLNRRGVCFFVQCKDCSQIFSCPNCSVSLTLHNDNELHCHYCGRKEPLSTNCPKCKKTNFIKKGIGTQQVVTILEKLFPTARIARADLNTTTQKKDWYNTIQKIHSGEIDIIVGTQSITKGYHFPNVTLVGILWADLNLHFPIYNAAETTLQQLIQVAGRAGREHAESLVIVQTMSDHRIFNFLHEIHYLQYYHEEIAMRNLLSYPPCHRLAEIELIHQQEKTVEYDIKKIENIFLKNHIPFLGPAIPPVAKIQNRHRRKIYLKNSDIKKINEAYTLLHKTSFKSSLYFTPNPLS